MVKSMVIFGLILVLFPVLMVLTPFLLLGYGMLGLFVVGSIGFGLLIAVAKVIAVTVGLALGGLLLLLIVPPIVVCALIFC